MGPPVEAIPCTPAVHNAWDNAIFEHSIGCQHVSYVQTATHGYDSTLVLDSMRAVGNNRALGLALLTPTPRITNIFVGGTARAFTM
jgi:hypothetical protein